MHRRQLSCVGSLGSPPSARCPSRRRLAAVPADLKVSTASRLHMDSHFRHAPSHASQAGSEQSLASRTGAPAENRCSRTCRLVRCAARRSSHTPRNGTECDPSLLGPTGAGPQGSAGYESEVPHRASRGSTADAGGFKDLGQHAAGTTRAALVTRSTPVAGQLKPARHSECEEHHLQLHLPLTAERSR